MKLWITVTEWIEIPPSHRLCDRHTPYREVQLTWNADAPDVFQLRFGSCRECGYNSSWSACASWRDLPVALLNDPGALVRHVRFLPGSRIEEPLPALDCAWALADGVRPLIAQAIGSTQPEPA